MTTVEARETPDALPTDEKKIIDSVAEVPKANTNYRIPDFSESSTTENATVDGSIDPAQTPFLRPNVSSTPSSPETLTADQKSKYEAMLGAASSWTEVPDSLAAKATKSPLTDSERMWLTEECLLRYLRASKWNLAQATKRLEATISWRREWGIEKHTAEYISIENETGKQIITGFDNQGRPCLYLNPHKQNTKRSDKQMHHLVFMLERCIDIMPPGQETLALLVNFKQTRQGDNASIGQGRQTIYILQNHYPERLGKSYVQEVPWLIWGFFKAISPFIDPKTREKMIFDADLRQAITPQQLIKPYGGDLEFEYDHAKYWPALNALADARREAMRKRWEARGKKIGESERYMKEGDLKEEKIPSPETATEPKMETQDEKGVESDKVEA